MDTRNETQNLTHAFDSDELFALARLDIEKGNVADALWRLKKITKADKVPTGAFSVCGQLYARLGLWQHALKMFQLHLERHPDAVIEKFSLGLAHGNIGRAAEALKIWDEVLQKQPKYAPALFCRALVRAQNGDHAAAKQDLEILVKSAAAEDPYLKPGKELLQRLEASRPSVAPSKPSPGSDAYAALVKRAYSTTSKEDSASGS